MTSVRFLCLITAALVLSACAIRAPSVKPTTDDYLQALPKAETEANQATNSDTNQLTRNMSSAIIHTSLGDIEIIFHPEPTVTVNNFIKLAADGFYDGVKFHRVIKNFMVQTGDPLSRDDDWSDDGMGGPGYTFKDEFNDHPLVRGSLAMANGGPDTNGSQFFIVTTEATPWLDGKHTNFGYVKSGMEVIDKIEGAQTNTNDHPLADIVITGITLNQ
ncbi:MAG: Peptidyl-prolyl cis-trans isomerase [Parcubacteria group bacterium GW2011_GWE2_43_12]|nr:MAG: Peptidyl-prolyl cis-trans isomerase [Parcubacteria group bacterium GW2011_GWE2_43_12]